MFESVLEQFEANAPISVMARLTLERAITPAWVDAVFEANRESQYSRELLFSTIVELMSLVSLGLHPSLHAAARKMPNLPVSLAALYDKVKHTEPAVLRALVQDSAQHLMPVAAELTDPAILPGWDLRIVDGNHLPASEKRLAAVRDQRAAALPGHTLVVYDPDRTLVADIVACEDAYTQERTVATPLLACAQSNELWIADRNFCTRTLLQGWREARADFLVREHAKHPRLIEQSAWQSCGRVETGAVYEQAIGIDAEQTPWRRIEVRLDQPTRSNEIVLRYKPRPAG
jgi:IS4 transposase